MSRLPVRVRLTLAFALAMALVLAAVGALLYVRLGDSLEEQLDESLEARAETIAALAGERGGELDDGDLASTDDEGFAQAFGPDGELLASSPSVAADTVISERELDRARAGAFFLRLDPVAGLDDEPARVLVRPLADPGETRVLVVGASLEDVEEALDGLLAQLLIVGPLALALSALAGYLLSAAALRPIEAMRRLAAEVSSERPGQRLPLPQARDEVHRLGETLNAMLARLEAGLARERRFVADASHELRTPLALLQTETELALRRPRSRADLERALRSAAEEVQRLNRLAEGLLVLARADEGRLALGRSSLSAGDLLDAVARRFAVRAAEAGRSLEVSAPAGESLVGDRVRLEQALGNLVDNALRHGAGTIRLAGGRRDGRFELRVSDDGDGFAPDFLPHAFDRFTRADEARSGGGAGLGLAIVDAVARAHGGTAHAANDSAGGAVVTLTLPANG